MPGKIHLCIPDIQDGPSRSKSHMLWLARLISERAPDVVIQLGDWSDWSSISTYERGTLRAEGQRLSKDWDSFRSGVSVLHTTLVPGCGPRLVHLYGNHEDRLDRYMQANPAIDTLPDPSNHLKVHGWEVYPYLKPVTIDGIDYAHFFPRGANGRVTQAAQRNGAASAAVQVAANMRSCTAGHKQGLDYAVRASGRGLVHGLIAGSFYQHDEHYLTVQGNCYWRGVVLKHNVRAGEYDPEFISMRSLKEKYGRP